MSSYIAFTDGRINDLRLKWSEDDDFWVRRIAIDHQLCRKLDTNEELLDFIERYRDKMNPLSLKEASKYL